MENRSVSIHVAGREYILVSNDPPEHVHRVAVYIDRKISEITASGVSGRETAAIMAALTTADELIKSQDDNTRLRKMMTDERSVHE